MNEISPLAKLVLFQLTSFQNDTTKQCNPSPERIAYFTGMAPDQVRRQLAILEKANLVQRSHRGFEILPDQTIPDDDLVPLDFWPSDDALDCIVASYPNHYFDLEEAVDDFIQFYRSREIRLAPERLNGAFISNISTILEHRRPGSVKIKRNQRGEEAGSLSAQILGGSSGSLNRGVSAA